MSDSSESGSVGHHQRGNGNKRKDLTESKTKKGKSKKAKNLDVMESDKKKSSRKKNDSPRETDSEGGSGRKRKDRTEGGSTRRKKDKKRSPLIESIHMPPGDIPPPPGDLVLPPPMDSVPPPPSDVVLPPPPMDVVPPPPGDVVLPPPLDAVPPPPSDALPPPTIEVSDENESSSVCDDVPIDYYNNYEPSDFSDESSTDETTSEDDTKTFDSSEISGEDDALSFEDDINSPPGDSVPPPPGDSVPPPSDRVTAPTTLIITQYDEDEPKKKSGRKKKPKISNKNEETDNEPKKKSGRRKKPKSSRKESTPRDNVSLGDEESKKKSRTEMVKTGTPRKRRKSRNQSPTPMTSSRKRADENGPLHVLKGKSKTRSNSVRHKPSDDSLGKGNESELHRSINTSGRKTKKRIKKRKPGWWSFLPQEGSIDYPPLHERITPKSFTFSKYQPNLDSDHYFQNWTHSLGCYSGQIESAIKLYPGFGPFLNYPKNVILLENIHHEHNLVTDDIPSNNAHLTCAIDYYLEDFQTSKTSPDIQSSKYPQTIRMKDYIHRTTGPTTLIDLKKKTSSRESESDSRTSKTDKDKNQHNYKVNEDFLGSILVDEGFDSSLRENLNLNLFSPKIYKPVSLLSRPLDQRERGEPYKRNWKCTIMLDIQSVEYSIGPKEPFFYELAIYNLEERKKVSESFYFNFNHDSKNVLKFHENSPFFSDDEDDLSNLKKLTFSLDVKSVNLFLVLRSTRLFGIDSDYANDLYIKGSEKNIKGLARLEAEASQAVILFPQFTQLAGWGCCRLFNEDLTLNDNIKYISIVASTKTHGEDIYQFLEDSDSYKGKGEMGIVILDASLINEHNTFIENYFDPSLNIIPTFIKNESENPKVISDPVRQLFSISDSACYPHTDLFNFLYLYPQNINFSFIKGKTLKNVLVKAYFFMDDKGFDPENSEKVFFGKSGNAQFISEYSFTVHMGSKKPVFNDELKIKLPYDPTTTMNVVFHFFNLNEKMISAVSSNKKKMTQNLSDTTPLGFSFIRLHNKSLLKDGSYELPFIANLEPGYLASQENYEKIFTIQSHLKSSIFPSDGFLYRICRKKNAGEKILEQCLRSDTTQIVQYFPIFINRILNFICNSKPKISQLCFETILYTIFRVDSATLDTNWETLRSYNPLINSYLNFHVKLYVHRRPLHEEIITNWIKVLNGEGTETLVENGANEIRKLSIGKYANFLFSIITRSLLLYKEDDDSPLILDESLHALIIKLIKTFVENLAGQEIPEFNMEIALWFSDLLYFVERGQVIDFIREYFYFVISSNTSQTLNVKIDFVRIITDHQFYSPLNCPVPLDIDSLQSLPKKFLNHCFFSGMIHDIVKRSYSSNTVASEVRVNVMQILRTIIWNHEMDTRYGKEILPYIASSYIPFLQLAVQYRNIIFNSPEIAERLDWMQCIAWILQYSYERSIYQLLSLYDDDDVLHFVDLLQFLFATFNEKEVLGEVSVIITKTIEIFSQAKEELLWNNIILFQNLMNLYSDMIVVKTDSTITISILWSLKTFIIRNSGPIFRDVAGTAIIEKIFLNLFSFENGNDELYSAITSIILLMLKINYEETGNLTRSKLFSIRAMCVLKETMNDVVLSSYANKIFQAIYTYTVTMEDTTLALMIQELMGRLYSISSYKIEFNNDPEIKSEHLFKMSRTVSVSTGLRIKYLKKLSEFNLSIGNVEESAQCLLLLADLISQYLNFNGENGSIFPSGLSLEHVCPNSILGIPIDLSHDDEMRSGDLSMPELENHMNRAAELITEFGLFEVSIDIYVLLMELFKTQKLFEKIVKLYPTIKELSDSTQDSILKNTRLFDNYYRVAFFGPGFNELDGTEYIYKEHPHLRVSDFCDKLINLYSNSIGVDITLLPNQPIETLEIEPDLHYLQIVSVETVPNPRMQSRESQVTMIDKCFGINRFSREMPYSPDGSNRFSEDVDKQWKIRHIYITERCFPDVVRRLKISRVENEIKGPLECSIDLITERTALLERELRLTPTNPKTMQIVLQGSVMLQVNAGPLAIARYFLSENRSEFPSDRVEDLRGYLTEFARKLIFCLKANNSVVNDQTRAHHEAMVEAYGDLTETLTSLGIKCIPFK